MGRIPDSRKKAAVTGRTAGKTASAKHPAADPNPRGVTMTKYQLSILYEFFNRNTHPNDAQKKFLTRLIQRERYPEKVTNWFSNTRQSVKRAGGARDTAPPLKLPPALVADIASAAGERRAPVPQAAEDVPIPDAPAEAHSGSEAMVRGVSPVREDDVDTLLYYSRSGRGARAASADSDAETKRAPSEVDWREHTDRYRAAFALLGLSSGSIRESS